MSAQSEYKNEKISVSMEDHPGCVAKLVVEVDPAATKHAYEQALKSVKREISLPGFRKGKAPDSVIIKNFSKPLKGEWEKHLSQFALEESVKLTAINPFGKRPVKGVVIKKLSIDEPSIVEIEIEHFPNVPPIDPAELSVIITEPPASFEPQVEEELQKLLLQSATWEEILDKPIEEADYVDLKVTSADDASQVYAEDTRFHVKKGVMADWLHDLLIGRVKGDEFEGNADEADKSATGENQPIRCHIKVLALQKAILPTLDDSLAQKYKCDDVAQLRERIANALKKQFEDVAEKAIKTQIRDQLIQKFPIEVPKSAGHKQEHIDQYRLWFIVYQFALDNNITVSDKELWSSYSYHYNMAHALEKDPKIKGFDEMKEQLFADALIDKVLDSLASKATQQRLPF